MKRELIDRLSDITNEEMSVLSDSYSLSSDAEPAFANMALRRRDYIWNVIGTRQTVTVKPHTRFVEIPVHSHSYVEMMYVCDGSITHFIDGQMLTLRSGELLLMNRHAKHSVSASGRHDIGMNFLISNDFMRQAGGKFRSSLPLSDFAENNLSDTGKSRWLVFRVGENSAIENLLENLIASSLSGENVPQIILSDTLSLIFRYLEMYPETLVGSTPHGSHGENEKAAITDYIQTNYRTASLTELSERLGMTPQYVSKLTVRLFGATFSGLVREKRFNESGAAASDKRYAGHADSRGDRLRKQQLLPQAFQGTVRGDTGKMEARQQNKTEKRLLKNSFRVF